MSSKAEIITDEITAPTLSEAQMLKRKPGGEHKYKPRMSTRVRWMLEDCQERTVAAQNRMRRILAWLDRERSRHVHDVSKLAHLGELDHELLGLALEVGEMESMIKITLLETVTHTTKRNGKGKKRKEEPVPALTSE